MATDSFKFWDAYYDALKFLDTDQQRAEFVMGLCAYVFDGEEPTFSSKETEFGFRLVKSQARESMDISARSREAGARGGRPKSTAKSTPLSTVKRGAKSEKKRSEANRNEASLLSTDNDQPAPPPAP
ncbi:DUF6291 domain-containing protein [uncultured Parolsenella sp.]|uniref:DUF6291 domain-containing protein n=1 Tax=uncultured Parolsenella sp. TaxID=2083008 RepID=UPI0025F9CAEB|nr:DUF6291 domain-containing protein [uncultured Parolsenella sp.]